MRWDIYIQMGKDEKSIEHFEKYASLNPEDANPLDSMAEAYFLAGRAEEAIAKFKAALEIKPDFYGTYSSIGYVYAFKENYPEAMKWIDKYIAMIPASGPKPTGFLWNGFFHYWLGSLGQSLADFQRAADTAEASGDDIRKALAEQMKKWIYADRGELELSRKSNEGWLNVYGKNRPGDEPFFKLDHRFFLGLIELKEGRIDSVKAGLAEMKSLVPDISPDRVARAAFSIHFLWKDADPDIPEVEEARKRLDGMKKLKIPCARASAISGLPGNFFNSPMEHDAAASKCNVFQQPAVYKEWMFLC